LDDGLIKFKKTFIIAKACDIHFASLKLAKKFVLSAQETGADVLNSQDHYHLC